MSVVSSGGLWFQCSLCSFYPNILNKWGGVGSEGISLCSYYPHILHKWGGVELEGMFLMFLLPSYFKQMGCGGVGGDVPYVPITLIF